MSFLHIRNVLNSEYVGKSISLRGWVYRHRVSGNVVFLVLRDATGIIQCTIKKGVVSDKEFDDAKDVYIESSVSLYGTVSKDERAPGGYEVKVRRFNIISKGEYFPISKDMSKEFLLDVRHLWLRSRKMTAIFKLRHYIINYLREYLNSLGFYELPPPIITQAACEGGSTLFELDFFGDKAYLSQSGQLYAEAYIYSLEKVYVLAPSFRAEKSRTTKHLAEYWHLEPEMAWYDWKDNIKLQEGLVATVIQRVVREHADLLSLLGRDIEELKKITPPFHMMEYDAAVDRVNEFGGSMEYGEDFGADEEMILTKDSDKPVFIHHFPKEIKAFYMPEDPNKPGTVLCDDLFASKGHGEIIGGSERIWKLDELMQRMEENNLDPKDYQWYIDLRKYGSVPHSGFGLGIERFVKWVLDLEHIRDAIPFPRTIRRAYP